MFSKCFVFEKIKFEYLSGAGVLIFNETCSKSIFSKMIAQMKQFYSIFFTYFVHRISLCRLFAPITSTELAKLKCTWEIFKIDFLENKALNEKLLFFLFDSFSHVESPLNGLYHQLHSDSQRIIYT